MKKNQSKRFLHLIKEREAERRLTCECTGSPASWSGFGRQVSGRGLGHTVHTGDHMISPSAEWSAASAPPPPPFPAGRCS